MTCTDETLKTKIKALKIYRFRAEGEKRAVISSLKLIELIQGIEKGVTVENVGEQDTLSNMSGRHRQKAFSFG